MPDKTPKIPVGIAVDMAHAIRTGACEPIPDGAEFRGHRWEPERWVLIYRLPDGQLEERAIPRWESDEHRARERRAQFRVVTTSGRSSPPER